MALLITIIYTLIVVFSFFQIIFAISEIKALLDRKNAKRVEALQVLPNGIIFKILTWRTLQRVEEDGAICSIRDYRTRYLDFLISKAILREGFNILRQNTTFGVLFSFSRVHYDSSLFFEHQYKNIQYDQKMSALLFKRSEGVLDETEVDWPSHIPRYAITIEIAIPLWIDLIEERYLFMLKNLLYLISCADSNVKAVVLVIIGTPAVTSRVKKGKVVLHHLIEAFRQQVPITVKVRLVRDVASRLGCAKKGAKDHIVATETFNSKIIDTLSNQPKVMIELGSRRQC